LSASAELLVFCARAGIGYHLTLVKNSEARQKNITRIIRKFVPNVQKERRVGSELNYLLPHESSPSFEELFNVLEQNRRALGIDSFGASVTTMEEVFIRYGLLSVHCDCFCVSSVGQRERKNVLNQ